MRSPGRSERRRLLVFVPAALAVLLATLLGPAAPASAGNLRLQSPRDGRISPVPLRIRDTIIDRTATPRARKADALPTSAYGGKFTAPDGTQFSLYQSPSYAPDAATLQNWADFFDHLVHGPELSKLTVYLAPLAEMQQLCSAEADSCYDFADERIVLLGQDAPDGVPMEDLAAHEYGHHLALNRRNDLGAAVNWGPEYWASGQHVCQLTAQRAAYPGDEGSHYELNPGEAWAETYRIMNGYDPNMWGIVSPSFYPDPAALALARRDVLSPYKGPKTSTVRGRFSRRGRATRTLIVPVQNDGSIAFDLRSSRSLDADVYVYSSRKSHTVLLRAAHHGHREHYKGLVCGYRHLTLIVRRHSGAGAYTLKLSLPNS